MNELKEKAIELEHVDYSVGSINIIKDITGSISTGKITTLVGPSGAGKTSLFRLINGLVSPTKGDIRISGKNIEEYEPTELRRNVGLALQNATMLSGSIYKNLALPRTLKKETLSEEEAAELLTSVGLEKDLLKRDVKDLSGGQRQKVSIARTLVNRPKILLLDEITSSLDRVSKQDIEELIVRINKEFHVTIMWITHNLEQAIHIGDETWVIMDGELLEFGESKLLLEPQNELVKQFVKGDIK
ncbi:amino acid ABC transporter ATP-binding protein [Bacillus sp. FJAT-18017]|uniref:ABC transporter ATP-binding protein n=1 Tax=Bacillus sp. FJAT-18017 TaxID=1705566 RepID=UPI0006B05FE8|nr:phosphate ABC transporter ATP-binding protein [Bacillus sp. FJAT-18017]ALC90637.1 amino acid ABC transporter ATP-binding protein [Bacillus sp. FJAT-18017]